MATRLYDLECDLELTPVWHQKLPEVSVSFAGHEIYHGKLSSTRRFQIYQSLENGYYDLTVEFLNKTNEDSINGQDMAVIVDSVRLNSITSPKFVWAGIYEPRYPEPWASQQTHLEPLLKNHTYLGWNGKWTLTLEVPIFTWIHKTQDLGWIYR